MINELPTVFDVVTGKKSVKEKTSNNNSGSNKTKAAGKVVRNLEFCFSPYYSSSTRLDMKGILQSWK
jgi:hypothetical protein